MSQRNPKLETFKMDAIEYRNPIELIPYANNAKIHTSEQIDLIAWQIYKFGFDQPIVINHHNVILKGHGRREAAIKLGMKEVPCVVREDLDEMEQIASRIGDNKSAISETDKDKLKFELGTLQRNGEEVKDSGFTQEEVAELRRGEEIPDFGPGSIEDQGQLDQKKPIECPNCGHEFTN